MSKSVKPFLFSEADFQHLKGKMLMDVMNLVFRQDFQECVWPQMQDVDGINEDSLDRRTVECLKALKLPRWKWYSFIREYILSQKITEPYYPPLPKTEEIASTVKAITGKTSLPPEAKELLNVDTETAMHALSILGEPLHHNDKYSLRVGPKHICIIVTPAANSKTFREAEKLATQCQRYFGKETDKPRDYSIYYEVACLYRLGITGDADILNELRRQYVELQGGNKRTPAQISRIEHQFDKVTSLPAIRKRIQRAKELGFIMD